VFGGSLIVNPKFRVTEMGLAAGYFHPAEDGGRSTIEISEKYFDGTMSAVSLVDTLIHEMIHQKLFEESGALPDHGTDFAYWADKLGVGHTVPKPPRVPKKGASRRIAKMLKDAGKQKPCQTLVDKIVAAANAERKKNE
jgi:hypothetical protein